MISELDMFRISGYSGLRMVKVENVVEEVNSVDFFLVREFFERFFGCG